MGTSEMVEVVICEMAAINGDPPSPALKRTGAAAPRCSEAEYV